MIGLRRACVQTAILTVWLGTGGVAAARRAHIPQSIVPFEHPEYWPHYVASPHFVVHYTEPGDGAMADEVMGDLEVAWRAQIDR